MHILWPVFDFFANNKTARWIAAGIAALFAFLSWQRLRDMRIRKEAVQKIDAKAEETSREIIQDAKDKTDETIRKSDEARASIPRGTASGELPKHVQGILFDD